MEVLENVIRIFIIINMFGAVISVFLILRKESRYKKTQILNISNHDSDLSSRAPAPHKPVPTDKIFSVTAELQDNLPPVEVLQGMREYYTPMQARDDIRIVQDCLNLIESTKSLETFFFRAELAKRTIVTLRQAEQAKVKGVTGMKSAANSVFKAIEDSKSRVLQGSFEAEKNKIDQLSTNKGKRDRWQKHIELLQSYEDEFDIGCEEQYLQMVNFIQEQIAELG